MLWLAMPCVGSIAVPKTAVADALKGSATPRLLHYLGDARWGVRGI